MSVLFETSLGDLIVDLEIDSCPRTSENFLKLCKTYYYNFCSFFNVQREFIAQTGDPTESGTGGQSIFSTANKLFTPEIKLPQLRHTSRGTLSMAVAGGLCGSQFFFTLADNIDYLDGKHAPFGSLVGDESFETLDKINQALVDDATQRPLRDIRIRHVVVLDDPFPDPPDLVVPPESPVPTAAQLKALGGVGDEEELSDPDEDVEAKEQRKRDREARAQALTLEMVGDLPFAEVRPPENVLFVCKLNRVTRSEDLELIFSRFGKILSCEVIRDKKTGDSLNYAFIEFDQQEEAERAYSKMDGVLIDDRRIMVDFSQSVSQLHGDWVYQRTGKRAPPGKGRGPPQRSRGGSGRRGGSGGVGSPVAPRDPDMVFDLASKYDSDRRRGHHGHGSSRRDRSRSPYRRRRDEGHNSSSSSSSSRYRDDRRGDGRRDDIYRRDRDDRERRR